MRTDQERERDVVRRILAALRELPVQRQGQVLWELASLYGRPSQWRRRSREDGKDPSDEGSFSSARFVLLAWRGRDAACRRTLLARVVLCPSPAGWRLAS